MSEIMKAIITKYVEPGITTQIEYNLGNIELEDNYGDRIYLDDYLKEIDRRLESLEGKTDEP